MEKVLKLYEPMTISRDTRIWISNMGDKQHDPHTYLMAGMMFDTVDIMVTFDHHGLLTVENVGQAIILIANQDMIPSPRLLSFDQASLNAPGGSIDLEIPVAPNSTTRYVMYRLVFFYESAYSVRITLEGHAKI